MTSNIGIILILLTLLTTISLIYKCFVELKVNERIPADCVLLWSGDPSGTVFIKTDQLDGETDWKLRNPINYI